MESKKNLPNAVAIFLCGGRGTRMRGSVADKIFAPLAGIPAFAHSLRAFDAAGFFSNAVFVFRDAAQREEIKKNIVEFAPNFASRAIFCQGGNERRDSVFNGLSAALDAGIAERTPAFIHDCARPLIRAESLRALAETAAREGAAVLAHRCRNTVKRVPVSVEPGTACLIEDLDRARLWETETPQVFPLGLIFAAYKNACEKKLSPTDDVAAAGVLGIPVALVENLFPNPKITLPEDLVFCETILKNF